MKFPATPAEAATDARTYLRRTCDGLDGDHPITTKVIDMDGDWSLVFVDWTYEHRGLEFTGSYSYSREAYDAYEQHIYGGLSRVVDLTSGAHIPVRHFV